MTAREHKRCMLSTAILEIELFGAIVSDSVRDYVRAWDEAGRFQAALTYGGSGALAGLYDREKAS